MAEKLCLQWNDFQENVKNAFGNLRDCTDFVDVTLACEDGRDIEAHKVILVASSPFFQRILKRNKHNHPMIYMRGMKSDDLTAIVDFLYYGEAKVYQEHLDGFLAIAEELQLKGLEGSKSLDGSNDEERQKPMKKHIGNDKVPMPRMHQFDDGTADDRKIGSNALASAKISVQSANFQELDEIVKAMMGTSENVIKVGNQQRRSKICKECGKEGDATDIKRHIETNHLEGVSVPCNFCGKIFRSRNALSGHISKNHKEQ